MEFGTAAGSTARWIGYGGIVLPSLLLALLATWSVRARRAPAAKSSVGRWAIAATLAFLLLDWGLLAALPRLDLSFGPVEPALILLAVLRLSLCLALLLAESLSRRRRTRTAPAAHRGGLLLLWLLHLAISAGFAYASYYEPFNLEVTHMELPAPGLQTDRPLRVLHITDPHIERATKRDRQVLELAQSLEPDLIVLTGDYLNLGYLSDPIALRDTRSFLSQLAAPMGVYAVNGTVDSPDRMHFLFEGLDIVVLDDQVQPVAESGLYIVGVSNASWGREWERDQAALRGLVSTLPEEAYSLLLYHTPDLIEAASETGVDLYLAGHTHGGQVRLPFYGALFTASRYGKAYEAGLYTLGETTLYISRGIGMEGFWITPRVRFLCPPEITLLTLLPEPAHER